MELELNKIYCEDCLDGMEKISNNSIDLIVTDPPYLINYKTNHRNNKEHEFCSTIKNDDNKKLIKNYISECYRILKDDSAFYCFSSSDKIDFFKQEIEKYFDIKNIIVWVKNNWTAGDLKAQYGKQYEFIIYANKGRREIEGKRLSNVWRFNRVVGNKQLHQNQKPLRLVNRIIKKSSNQEDVIFDGFIGSGTTAVSAKSLNRFYLGFEIEQKYIDIANKRLKQKTFNELF